MELHHKLRRDPSWHPSGCNICGQLGHQAVNCTNGTINWRQIYGDDAFRLKTPIYPSDEDRMKKEKQVDIAALENQAREWAKTHANTAAPVVAAASAASPAVKLPVENGAAGILPADAGAPPGTPPVEAPLPDGWAAAKDAQGRIYYWHKATKKTQWDRPTANTPIS